MYAIVVTVYGRVWGVYGPHETMGDAQREQAVIDLAIRSWHPLLSSDAKSTMWPMSWTIAPFDAKLAPKGWDKIEA